MMEPKAEMKNIDKYSYTWPLYEEIIWSYKLTLKWDYFILLILSKIFAKLGQIRVNSNKSLPYLELLSDINISWV